MKRFRDFAHDESLSGDKLQISELFNREIILTAFRVLPSKISGKECLQLQFHYPDKPDDYVVFTNSTVLIRQLQQYQNELPFIATIIKRASYYTLS